MKIGSKFQESRRQFAKDHRSLRKAINAAHDAKVRLWRIRRKLLTHMKMTSIRKYRSNTKLPSKLNDKPLKYMRIRRKDVPLPFSPFSKRYSPTMQDSAFHYHRNEVRNPSAVYVFDSAVGKFEPIREAKSASFTEFIEWDRNAFRSSNKRRKPASRMKSPVRHLRPFVAGEDEVSLKPLEPLDIELPPITSSEVPEKAMEYCGEGAPLDWKHTMDVLPTVPSTSSITLDLLNGSQPSGNRPLIISEYFDVEPSSLSPAAALDPLRAFISDSPEKSGALSSNAAFCDTALSSVSDAQNPPGCSLVPGYNDCPISLPPGLELHAIRHINQLGIATVAESDALSLTSPTRGNSTTFGASSGSATRVSGSGSWVAALHDSLAGEQHGKTIGQQLAASVSSSSSRLFTSLSGPSIGTPPLILQESDIKPLSAYDSTHQVMFPISKQLKPVVDISRGRPTASSSLKFIDSADRCTFLVQHLEEKLAVSDEGDIEMQALPAFMEGALEQKQRWSLANTFRSLVAILATAFLSPWRLVLNFAIRN